MDFTGLLEKHANKHKSKPVQFCSIAGRVEKSLERNIKIRKSSRLTVFDTQRNIVITESPVKLNDKQTKQQHRLHQLRKWKEEKDKKKKEEAKNKKKPFVAGVPHSGLQYEPPPHPSKVSTSSSGYTGGRVTRSQSAKVNAEKKANDIKSTKRSAETSFAPENATFKAPHNIKNFVKLPILVGSDTLTKSKCDKKSKLSKIAFEPVTQKTNLNMLKPKLPMVQDNQPKKVTKQTPANINVNSRSRRNPTLKSKSDITLSIQKRKPVQSSTPYSDLDQPIVSSPILQSKITPRRSNQRTSKNFTPKTCVPKSESSSEEKLRSPKNTEAVPMTPEQIVEESKKISPCVTLSRGKANARKEMKKKIDEGLLDEDASGTESVEHFRRQLNSEITRLTEMCQVWDKISNQTILPEPVQELVLAAVGQAQLLMKSKFQQFASLVERCANPEPGSPLVTLVDLRAFWDVVFLQVVNVDMRFKKLEELRSRNWIEEQIVVKVKKPKPQVKKVLKQSGSSRMREIIAAARKAKQQQREPQSPADSSQKTFEAGFFSVQSPIRSPALPTPIKPTLLKAVLSNETQKSASKSAASLAIMRASLIGKAVEETQLATTPTHLNPINLFATPARSILKPSHVASTQKSGKKSVKVVLFDESDVEQQDTSFKNTKTNESPLIRGVELLDINTDSCMSSMEQSEKKENIGSGRRKSYLLRQEAIDEESPVLTRSRRKSAITPMVDKSNEDLEEKTPKRSSRKKVLQEVQGNVADTKTEIVTPKRSSRRRKTVNTLLIS